MPKTIWKYPLDLAEFQAPMMPEGAELLSVQMQGGNLCLWALVDPDARKRSQIIRIAGTGHPYSLSECYKHVGTVQDGPYVWHVFADTSFQKVIPRKP